MEKSKLKPKRLLFIELILLLIVGSFTPVFTVISVVIFAVVFSILNYKCVTSQSLLIPQIALLLILFQNFGIGIGAHLGRNLSDSLSLMTQVPTLFLLISFCVVIFNRPIQKLDFIFYLFALLLVVYYFVGEGLTSAKMVYIRNFSVFYFAYTIGNYYLDTSEKRLKYLKYFINSAILAGIFGLVGVILGNEFYLNVGVLEVYNAKQYTAYVNGLPGNFRTLVNSVWVNRLASLYYDPVNFSYFMSLAVLLSMIYRSKKTVFFLILCEILTFGKGGLLILGTSIGSVLVHKLLSRQNSKFKRNTIIGLVIIGVAALAGLISTFKADAFGTYMHFYGIITGLEMVLANPMGHGLGTAGNIVRSFTDNGIYDISETGLINMVYQIGIVAVFLFIAIIVVMSNKVISMYSLVKNKKDRNLYLLFSYIPFVLLIVSVFQENTLTPQCITPYMLILGSLGVESNAESGA